VLNTETECAHETVAERALLGTWVLDEVRLAVQKGYKVIEIYEVYEYKVTQYDPQIHEGGVFVDYINTFLKLNAVANGYTNWVQSPEDKDRYIQNFNASEGILLDKDALRSNASKRPLAKLCLNSMWGKLTERTNRTRTKMISDPHELYCFLATLGIEVANLMFASDDVLWASWRFTAEEKYRSYVKRAMSLESMCRQALACVCTLNWISCKIERYITTPIRCFTYRRKPSRI
jgi:hypothetical protein